MSERLPDEWTRVPLASLVRGPGRYGASASAVAYDANLPRYVRITDIDDHGRLRPASRASIDRAQAKGYRLRPHDLVLARSGATVGKSYLYRPEDGECAYAGYLVRFALDPARCVPSFVSYYTQSERFAEWVRATVRGSVQPNINIAELSELPVPLPPRAEQRAIVAARTDATHLIDSSAQVVEKLGRVFRSLVVELLTAGVDERGQLRPLSTAPGSAAFDAPPPSFPTARVDELLADVDPAMRSGPFGSELKKADLVSVGVPLLGIDNIEVDHFVARYSRFVPTERARELARYTVRPHDVMITVMGTVGRSCLVPTDIGPALSSKHIWALTFDPSRYHPLLASLQINHAPWVAAHFRREAQGGALSAIRSETLRSLRLPLPPRAEQDRIAAVLGVAQARLATERAALAKHRRVFRALLDELVSGRVRVGGAGAGQTSA